MELKLGIFAVPNAGDSPSIVEIVIAAAERLGQEVAPRLRELLG